MKIVYKAYQRVARAIASAFGPEAKASRVESGAAYDADSFHMYYPLYKDAPKRIVDLSRFQRLGKAEQRMALGRYVNVPFPHRHAELLVTKGEKSGSGISVVRRDDVPIYEVYTAPLLPRRLEARIIYVYQKPVFAYRRTGPPYAAWNLRFAQTRAEALDLRELQAIAPEFFADFDRWLRAADPDIAGVDVTITGSDYYVLEVNMSPGMAQSVFGNSVVDAVVEQIRRGRDGT